MFIDANILFSVAWSENSSIRIIWSRTDIQLVTSLYALTEAERNIQSKRPLAVSRLSHLAGKVEISNASTKVGNDHSLPAKDLPILESAVGSACQILLTGDVTHFGHLMDLEMYGVKVLTVSRFLASLNSSP